MLQHKIKEIIDDLYARGYGSSSCRDKQPEPGSDKWLILALMDYTLHFINEHNNKVDECERYRSWVKRADPKNTHAPH